MRKDLIVKWVLVILFGIAAIVTGLGAIAFENIMLMFATYALFGLGYGLAKW